MFCQLRHIVKAVHPAVDIVKAVHLGGDIIKVANIASSFDCNSPTLRLLGSAEHASQGGPFCR